MRSVIANPLYKTSGTFYKLGCMEVKVSAESKSDQTLTDFTEELTTLSHRYKLGITGEPILFVLEEEDTERQYTIDHSSRLEFA
jgi:hypothetical protein